MRLDELAGRIGAQVCGDGAKEVNSVNTLDQAAAGQLSFLSNPKYLAQLKTTGATAVIVAPGVDAAGVSAALLRAADPYYAFAQAVVALHGHRVHRHAGVHSSAHVEPTASVGEGTVIYPGAYVGPRAKIGRDCILYPNAVVYDDCVLGDRVIIHAGTSIGSDGFGYATHKGEHTKIPQVGNVVIEDDVEIGANCCIARAAMGSTVIGRGTKIDALVMIGHGVKVGPHGLLVAQVGIAGSTTLGHHVTLAGQVGIAGHVKIGNQVTVAAQSGVSGDIEDGQVMLGSPAMPIRQGRRVYVAHMQLPELLERIRALEAKVGLKGS